MLKSFREKRRSRLADNTQGLMGGGGETEMATTELKYQKLAITFVLVKTHQNVLLKYDQNCTHY